MDKSLFSHDYETRLREARRRAGATQARLAERLGQTQSFVSKCERGERRLDLVEVRAFCKALGLSFPEFVAEVERRIGEGATRLPTHPSRRDPSDPGS